MKRIGKLFDTFCSYDNLHKAWRKAYKGSNRNADSLRFFYRLETELLALQEALASGEWQPQPYRYFEIFDPKQRTISVASFRDRVVHHALIRVLEPVYERRFIFDSYATRPAKGSHAAVARAQDFIRHNQWFFKSDVEKYFDSIRHDRLMEILACTIKDKMLLQVLEKIVRNGGQNGVGLPIGNLTSQFLANVYLHPFDMFIKQDLQCRHYLRYMDDFVVFDPDKEHLKEVRIAADYYLRIHLDLHLKESASYLNSASNGLSFLGKRIFPSAIRLHNHNGRRITRRLKRREYQWQKGELDDETFQSSVNSYWALLKWYPWDGLRRQLF
jgi:retron-type reverse transcriptase